MKVAFYLAALLLLLTGQLEAGTYTFDKSVVEDKQVIGERDQYVAIFGGFSFYNDIRTDFFYIAPDDGPFYEGDFNLGRDSGWIAGVALGVYKGQGWRLETEFTHHVSSVSSYSATVTGSGNANLQGPLSGDIVTNSLMLNVVKDFGSGKIRPYLGAGAGLSWVDLLLVDDPAFRLRANDLTFGYQVFGGLSFQVSERLTVFGEYRLIGCANIGPADYSLTPPGFQSQVDEFDLGVSSHVILGLRLDF